MAFPVIFDDCQQKREVKHDVCERQLQPVGYHIFYSHLKKSWVLHELIPSVPLKIENHRSFFYCTRIQRSSTALPLYCLKVEARELPVKFGTTCRI